MTTATQAIEKARDLTDEDISDQAYVHYLRASEITINIIPNHPAYSTISQHPTWHREFASLMMVQLFLSLDRSVSRVLTNTCASLGGPN